ncbi:hypothetical protein [Bacillus paranthracis]|uniref:hypothetical protein n=1 Tax=Bacillus paranthracis TaxID=2026186 RepID=UPI0022E0601F|nr:hypothetical protein [Bacillus paranthracis]
MKANMVDTLAVATTEGNLVIERDVKHDQFITVKAEGIEVTYFEVEKAGSKDLKRKWATINGVQFHTDPYNWYWQKGGRGGYKNKEMILETLKAVDTFIYNEGYFFEKKWY